MPGAKESPKPLIIPDGGAGAGGGRNNTAKHDTTINGSSNAKQTHKRGDDSKVRPAFTQRKREREGDREAQLHCLSLSLSLCVCVLTDSPAPVICVAGQFRLVNRRGHGDW